MIYFIVNFILILVFWLITSTQNKNEFMKKMLPVFFVSILAVNFILLLALRSPYIGIDTLNYLRRFRVYGQADWALVVKDQQELGFSILIRIVSKFTDDFQWFLLIYAVITIIPIFAVIFRYSKMPFLSIMLFVAFDYYASTFTLMRQWIAISFCFLAYSRLREKKFIPYLILVLLAAQFHKTAYIFLPAYFVNFMKPGKITYIILAVLYVVIAIFKVPMYNFVQQMWYESENYALQETTAFIWPLIISGIGIITLIFAKDICEKDPKDNTVVFLLSIAVILAQFLFLGSNSKRASIFYSVYLIFAIPCIIQVINNIKIKNIILGVMCAGTCAMFIFSIATDMYQIIPYMTFLE